MYIIFVYGFQIVYCYKNLLDTKFSQPNVFLNPLHLNHMFPLLFYRHLRLLLHSRPSNHSARDSSSIIFFNTFMSSFNIPIVVRWSWNTCTMTGLFITYVSLKPISYHLLKILFARVFKCQFSLPFLFHPSSLDSWVSAWQLESKVEGERKG